MRVWLELRKEQVYRVRAMIDEHTDLAHRLQSPALDISSGSERLGKIIIIVGS